MNASNKRHLNRWFHILTGAMIATYIYSPWAAIPEYALLAKAIVLPLLIATALQRWKGYLLKRAFQSRAGLLLAFALATGLVSAQDRVFGGSGTFDIGIQTMDPDGLNDVLTPAGYGSLSGPALTIGGSGQGYVNNWVIGGEGAFYGFGEANSPTHELELAGGYGLFTLGYIPLQGRGFLFYPSLGAGVAGTGLDIRARQSESTFAEVIGNPDDNPTREVDLGTVAPYFKLAVNLHYFPLRGEGSKRYGPMLGLSAGYAFAPGRPFRQGAADLAGSPDFSPGGFFLTLKLGGGFLSRK